MVSPVFLHFSSSVLETTNFYSNIRHFYFGMLYFSLRNQDSSGGIVKKIGSNRPKHHGSIPSKGKRFFLFRSVKTARRSIQPSTHLSGSEALVKNKYPYTSSPPYAFAACRGKTLSFTSLFFYHSFIK